MFYSKTVELYGKGLQFSAKDLDICYKIMIVDVLWKHFGVYLN